MLKLAKNLELPLDFCTERIAFLARTGAGKSGGMRVMFEQMFDAGLFSIFIDPKGDAWGIRATGVGEGKPVLVMGGDHGDVPLEAMAGKVIAEFLVRERVSAVLDISDFGKADMVRFVTDLCRTLYKLNRDVVHIFLDEADMVAGEKFYDPKCLEAIQLVQNKGRHRGFGMTVATQRSAMINKTVLYASGTLIAMQTTSSKDIGVVREWVEVVSSREIAKQIVAELPLLKTREALVYSPQILGSEPVRITFDTFQTFDSMRTPKPGEARQTPKSLADIDLSTVQRDMAATIEKVRAEDPRTLQAEVAKLRRELEQAQKAIPQNATATKPAQDTSRQNLRDSERKLTQQTQHVNELRQALENAMKYIIEINARDFFAQAGESVDEEKIQEAITAAVRQAMKQFEIQIDDDRRSFTEFKKNGERILRSMEKLLGKEEVAVTVTVKHNEPFTVQTAASRPPVSVLSDGSGNSSLPEGERKILIVIAQYSDRGGASRDLISILTGYARSSRNTYISRLSVKGCITGSQSLFITADGLAALGDYERMPEGYELQQWWLNRLPEGEAKILRIVIAAYPASISRDQISAETDYARSSRNTYISRLSVKRLVAADSDGITAAADLF